MQRASEEEVIEEEGEQPIVEPATEIDNLANEPISVLRNRLFTNREEVTDTSTEHVLQHHRMLQDDVSDAMLGMAQGLKQRSIAFGEALKEDSKVFSLSLGTLLITVN
jgi:Membrane fusion protein Use1